MSALSRYEGLTLRRLTHGGYIVTHPDIYNEGSLYFASTSIVEAFAFMRTVIDKTPDPPPRAHD